MSYLRGGLAFALNSLSDVMNKQKEKKRVVLQQAHKK